MTVKNIKEKLKELKEKQEKEKQVSVVENKVKEKLTKPVKAKENKTTKPKLPSPKQMQNELNQKIEKVHRANPPSLFRLPVGSEFSLKYQEDQTWLGVLKVPGEESFTMTCISGEWALRILGKQWYLKQKVKENGTSNK